ncbi:penicillin acylase family protein [Flagellimonas sp. S174]|uniref:penicillin acylase family protein n=1 Tax=Flagellimonas sp. S174 TaxID=3410790 RepID=UPI003BF54024
MGFRVKLLVVLLGVNYIVSAQQTKQSEIRWDTWGVPHIFGTTETELYYGFGWAQMKAHCNLILKSYGKSRGRSAEYWGGDENLTQDVLLRKLDIPNRAKSWFEAQDVSTKRILKAFVQGMNDYCKAHPESIKEYLKQVLPIQNSDPLAKLQMSYHLMVGAFTLQKQAGLWKNAGSNAWAIAPSKSDNGNPMLMMQPHPPWFDDFLFFESHLTGKNLNVYGISLVGSPTIAMGFNDHLGWGLTFNQADAMDLIELDFKEGYYKDNTDWKKIQGRTETIKIKEGEGFKEKVIKIKETNYGFIIDEKRDKAIALRLSGLDRPFFDKQFLNMAKSKNLRQFEKAMKMLQLPLQNIIYADKHGQILYLYNGIIPKRPSGELKDWSGIINASLLKGPVESYVDYNDLPKIKNPKSGFVANSNNNPWTSTYPFIDVPIDYPQYIAPKATDNFDLRSTRSIKLLLSKSKLSFQDLEEMQSSTYSEMADRCLDELIDFANKSNDTVLIKASKVLQEWDKKLDNESVGAVLFVNWYFMARKKKMFQTDFDLNDPLNTPHTLTDNAKQILLNAAKRTLKRYGSLDVPWKSVYKTKYGDYTVDGGLGLGEIGSFNAGFYQPINSFKYQLAGGSAYTAVIEFGELNKARGILAYGNASENDSPFKGDQIKLLTQRKLRSINFYEQQINQHLHSKEILEIHHSFD